MCGSSKLMRVANETRQMETNWLMSCMYVESNIQRMQLAVLNLWLSCSMTFLMQSLFTQSQICPGRSKIKSVDGWAWLSFILPSTQSSSQPIFWRRNSIEQMMAPLGPIQYSSMTSSMVMRSLRSMWWGGKLWLAGSRLTRTAALLPNIWVQRWKRWVAREDLPEPLAPRRKTAFIVVELKVILHKNRVGRQKEFQLGMGILWEYKKNLVFVLIRIDRG